MVNSWYVDILLETFLFKVFLQYLMLTVQAHTVYVTWGSPGNVAALHCWQ